jgi:multiple sugar transport system substrate-binding protein
LNRDFYNDKLELNVEKEGALDALNAAITMRQKGLDARLTTCGSNEANAAFGSGAIASVAAGCWYGGFLKGWIAPDTAGKWGVAHLPGGLSTLQLGRQLPGHPVPSPEQRPGLGLHQSTPAPTPTARTPCSRRWTTSPVHPGVGFDIYSAEDPFFGGQKTRELWVEIAKNTQPTFATLMDTAAEGPPCRPRSRSGLNENKTAEEIIADMKARIENDTRDDYEKMQELMEDAASCRPSAPAAEPARSAPIRTDIFIPESRGCRRDHPRRLSA